MLREKVEEVTTLKRDNARRIRVEYNTKRSVLRSFKWKISKVDPDLFRVATAFWGATQDNSETEISTRTTKEMRKKTLKALILMKQCVKATHRSSTSAAQHKTQANVRRTDEKMEEVR